MTPPDETTFYEYILEELRRLNDKLDGLVTNEQLRAERERVNERLASQALEIQTVKQSAHGEVRALRSAIWKGLAAAGALALAVLAVILPHLRWG